MLLMRAVVAAAIIVTVSTLGHRFPRFGALLLALPLVSLLAFVFSWMQHQDLPAISRVARGMLLLVPLSWPFFVPIAFAERLGLGFWSAIGAGSSFCLLAVLIWHWLIPRLA
jgi:hypothetical protein